MPILFQDIAGFSRHSGERATFAVMRTPTRELDPCRPLLVLVHPGDMIAHRDCWDDADWPAVRDFCRNNITQTGTEILSYGDADSVVLHRGSCIDLEKRFSLTSPIQLALRRIWRHGAVLFGDDVIQASSWIARYMAVTQRSEILLSGAYSDPNYGCLTAIGKALEKVAPHGSIKVSPWAPADNGPPAPGRHTAAWTPYQEDATPAPL
jgi:hypothetical protein